MSGKPVRINGPIEQIRTLVRTGFYLLSHHIVRDYIEVGEFDEHDVEMSILTGEITRVEDDELRQALDGKKYVIVGRTASGLSFGSTGKTIEWDDGIRYFVITAFVVC